MKWPGAGPAALLRHRGHGPVHYDLVLGTGRRCATIALDPGRPWTWRDQPPHRRRYLSFSGPIGAGRGSVTIVWSGCSNWHRIPGGWRAVLGPIDILLRWDRVVLLRCATHCAPCLR